MKNKFYASATALTIFITGALVVRAQEGEKDLSMRTALYVTGAKTDKIDLSKDRYVAAGATIEIKKSEAVNCEGNECTFNIGFIAFRSGSTGGQLSTYGLLQLDKGGSVGNTVYFAAGEKTKQAVLPLKLRMGTNKVTFVIDPYRKTAESNEDNNSFSVNFRVVPGPARPEIRANRMMQNEEREK